MIQIVNWLLTRRCNLNCDYCAIVKNYETMPICYPDMNHYRNNEMSTEVIIHSLMKFKRHNPEMFHIFYGGEPLLRKDLADIVNYCNDNKIYYTIISNNTPAIQPKIEKLFERTDYVEGFTSSVDPSCMDKNLPDEDRIRKSVEGFKRLKLIQETGKVKDVVAEITVMDENKHLLYPLVHELSNHDIYSDITFVDIAKSSYYDFSNVFDMDSLVHPSYELADTLSRMVHDDSLLIHMKDILLPWMFDTLPSNFDCDLENGVHNVTIDADGQMRLCLRIRGEITPIVHVSKLFEDDAKCVTKDYFDLMRIDKRRHCKLCNHSCLMMSKHIDKHGDKEGELVHKNKREE